MTLDHESTPAAPAIESDALRANLLETAVAEVTIDPAFTVLLDIVRDYRGIENSATSLLLEISHPFHNWKLILPKLRAFVLKNNDLFRRHARGPEAFARFIDLFMLSIDESRKNEVLLAQALDALLGYLDRLIASLDKTSLAGHQPALAACFDRLTGLDDRVLLAMAQGNLPVARIIGRLLAVADQGLDLSPAGRLYSRLLAITYTYWLAEEDPLPWFTAQCQNLCAGWEAGRLFTAISHQRIGSHLDQVKALSATPDRETLTQLLALPGHLDIVRLYKQVPDQLIEGEATAGGATHRFAENRKLLFLFRIMDTAGLALIHEESLREINRSLVQLIREQSYEEIESFLLTTFKLLKVNVRKYPHTSMQCIQVLGTEVFNRGNSRLVESFLWETVRFGFQYANVCGVDEDWQPLANPAHLPNIRVWLNLIMQEPKWCSTLFSALIINLKLSGTCIKDTDLFQRDITRLLNHPVAPVYNLVKQFAKLVPVYYNEIGSEGLLRDVSTELDELHSRHDLLIHFLRKQSHVESNNLIVGFIEAIFSFWLTRDKTGLTTFLPEEVLRQVRPEGPFVDDLHRLMREIMNQTRVRQVSDLLVLADDELEALLAQGPEIAPREQRRFVLLVRMYKLVDQKYNLGTQELRLHLTQAANGNLSDTEALLAALESDDTARILAALLDHLEALQKTILAKEIFEAKEDIYYKRHVAVDIPSVYGRYRERKFDALSLTFRLENLANLYLEKLPATVNLAFITRATFIRIIHCLRLYLRALAIDGIASRRLLTYMALLESSSDIKRFSFTQYLDIFRGLSEGVKDVIYTYYTNIHQNNLSILIPQIGRENLLPKYRTLWNETAGRSEHDSTYATDNGEVPDPEVSRRIMRLSESFLRDLIAGTFGLQHLDNFITRIQQTLERQKELLDGPQLDLLMTYNPGNAISFLHRPNRYTHNLIHLGNKGYNLTQLATDDKPVPPGFIITTEIFRCWPVVREFVLARDEFMSRVRQSLTALEEKTGRKFGDPEKPLLLSVRSGAAISMPGMMATIHNVGMNAEIAEEFGQRSGNVYLAWDNYRRFLQSWAMTTGIEREVFQTLMNEAKAKAGVLVKREFAPEQMKALALKYQKTVRSLGIGIPDDPWLQLMAAVEMVFNSWNTAKTREYRALMDISESWGTAVIVQTMVFGNLSKDSGSGVLFTAHPYRKVSRVALWGDYAPADQGEDIVSGLVTTYPISVEQAEIDGRNQNQTLERRFPKIYEALLTLSRELVYQKGWNPQEIEFTFEGPEAANLFILQTRDMITIKKKESFAVFVDGGTLARHLLGKGIGVSGSALAGRAVFSAGNIKRLKAEDPHTPLILIRQDTVPEDIKEISMADGLLTARGGQTSHAAVVATRLEKTCVVGCNALKVMETEEYCEINGHTIRTGDPVSIDGRKGLFLLGRHPVKNEVHILPI